MARLLTLTVIVLFLSFCSTKAQSKGQNQPARYILFDVNPGEGFNLRRDVYMRMAIFVKRLNENNRGNFILVLPPWGRLWHWQSPTLRHKQLQIPWRRFFDLDSINRFVPAIDVEDFLESHEPIIDTVFYLQRYKEGWTDGKFETKHDIRECIASPQYKLEASDLYKGWFWGYDQLRARDFKCLSLQGGHGSISDFVVDLDEKATFLDRAETLMHDPFGDLDYWTCRRSMRFNSDLVAIADEFRKNELNSDDVSDGTMIDAKWEEHIPVRGKAKGGNYLCLHYRRKDYLNHKELRVPQIPGAVDQMTKTLRDNNLDTIFVSTDGTDAEYEDFKSQMPEEFKVTKFKPTEDQLETWMDGGVAIIDQIICSHARIFVGSAESTFSFRIQEEREIMGFDKETTFNVLCKDGGGHGCKKAAQWIIKYPPTREGKTESHTEL